MASPAAGLSWAAAIAGHSATSNTPIDRLMATPLACGSRLRRRRRRGEIGAAAARNELALRVEDRRLGGRELAAHADDLALDGEVARQGDGMIVHAHVDGRHAAAELSHHGPVGAEIDQRRENAAVGEAAFDIDHPFLAPGGLDLDAVVMHSDDFQPQPLVIRRAGDQRLDLFQGQVRARTFCFVVHGVTTTLPKISRSWMSRSPSRACSSGSTLSTTGLILPCWISVISPARSSS